MHNWIIAIVAAFAGFALGVAANYLTRILVRNRTSDTFLVWYINYRYSILFWGCVVAALLGWQGWTTGSIEQLIRLSVIAVGCICISACDLLIRRVPNSMLLLLLANAVVFALLNLKEFHAGERFLSVLAVVILFSIPSSLHLNIGWGDIKFAVVIALSFSVLGLLQSMAIMGIGFLIAAIYLLISKKGNLKTSIPMGPFLAFGMILTTVFPIF